LFFCNAKCTGKKQKEPPIQAAQSVNNHTDHINNDMIGTSDNMGFKKERAKSFIQSIRIYFSFVLRSKSSPSMPLLHKALLRQAVKKLTF